MKTEQVLPLIALTLVAGSVCLAVVAPETRAGFIDLTKVVVGAYIGLLIPRRSS